ncbi:MAG: PrgI family protein [Propionibacteriaceae bacterium]|jgi:hypothetical protein|nr:PrgI family protein [Propionibacteriaceae bacterium]
MSVAVYGEFQKDKSGLFFGLTGPKLAGLFVALMPCLLAVSRSDWGAVGWTLVLFAAAALVIAVPIRGRSSINWLATFVAHSAGSASKLTEFRSKAMEGENIEEADLPGLLKQVKVHDGPPEGPQQRRVGIIQNHANLTWAATAAITFPGIKLADVAERALLADGLRDLLNAAARTEMVEEILFIVRSVPDDGEERHQYLLEHLSAAAPAQARHVTEGLAQIVSQASVQTEAFCTVTVSEAALKKNAKHFGKGMAGRMSAMVMLLAEMETKLRSGLQMDTVRWLTSPELAVAVRTGFAPGDRAQLVAAGVAKSKDPKVNADVPWPMAGPSGAHSAARHYEHDAWWSSSDVIRLPGKGAVMGALAPVLMPQEAGERRSLLVGYPIMSFDKAQKLTRKKEATADMAEAINEKMGRKMRASERKQVGRTRRLDEKLDSGNAMVRPYALATVTVPRTMSIAEFSQRLHASIRNSGFAPLPVDLSQDHAFFASVVPLGLSLVNTKKLN